MRKTVPFLLAMISSATLVVAQEDRPKQPEASANPPATDAREAKPAAAQTAAKPEPKPVQPAPAEVKLAQAATPSPATPARRAQGKRNESTPAPSTPAPGQAATPTPKPKKPGFFQRLFGRRPKATPMPVATPIPHATPTPRPRRPRPSSTPSATTEQSTGTQTAASPEKPSVPPAGKTEEKKTADQPPAPGKTAEQKALDEAMASGDASAIEKAKYDDVKSRAAADPKVMELKEKADAAPTEEEGRKALRAYNKALFQKMRSLDSSIKERIDQMEAAVMKRL